MSRRVASLGALALAGLLSGCLGDPPIEERWTRLEVMSGPDAASIVPGQPTTISVTARITYREILTGAVIAEVRASTSLQPADTGFEFDSDPLGEARDVDEVLRNSVSLGFASRAVTGFDHLVQDIPLTIDSAGLTPPIPNSTAADSLQGTASGLFLVVYFGQVDEVEIAGGEEIDVVTPFFSDQWEILSTGVELTPGS
jgi:hypothetical protein